MIKSVLLTLLLASLGHLSYTNDVTRLDELMTGFVVYSFIITVYAVYWRRQENET